MSALANNFKVKFAGLLRGLLQRMDNGDGTEPTPARSAPPGALPRQTAARLAAGTPAGPQPATTPAAQAAPTPASPSPAPVPARAANASELEMPLLPVLERLPADLRSKWVLGGMDLSRATIAISVEKVLPQLALGAVKITFGELRRAAPTLFRSGEEYDSLPITLPLNEVLPRLNPAMMSRNRAQKTVAPPADITAPFGPGAQGVTFANTLLKPTPPTTHFFRKAPSSLPSESGQPIKMTPPSIAPPPVVPPAIASPPSAPPPAFGQRAITPSAGIPETPALPRATRPVPSFPSPISDLPPAAERTPIPKPITPAMPPPPPSSESLATPTIFAPLAALSEEWPESLRQEIVQLNLVRAQVALPVHLIEPSFKRGRVIFPWHYLRTWIRPAPPLGASVHDALELELPLKVLAPLFLPKQKNGVKPQSKTPLPPSSVPNLFFGFPQPQPEELVAPINMPEAVPPIKPLDAKLAETNYYVWGDGGDAPRVDETEYKRPIAPATDFSSRQAMPKDIVERAMKLPSVAGAVIALPDGLKVAHQVPATMNPDTIAAFLPQLFSRLAQCCKELRMGEVNNLNFTIGKVPWKIFRVNAVYFAAFGHAGEPLPTAQLAELAGELDRKK